MDKLDVYFRLPIGARTLALAGYAGWQARKRLGRGFRSWYSSLLESQWLSETELRTRQLERLKAVLRHAYDHVRYYRRAFDQVDINPSDIACISDLTKLPLLTREVVVTNLRDLRSDDIRRYSAVLTRTSGSTGQKLEFFLPGELKWTINSAILWRFYSWAGVKPGDRRATLGARVFAMRPPYWAWNRWESQLLLSSHHLDSDSLHQYAHLLRTHRIVFIQGHPSAIAVLAEHLVGGGECLPMKAVFTTGETVYDEDRRVIQQAFDCQLLDTYGMGESAAGADECPEHMGYHEASEYSIVELEPVGDGLCEIVGTSLFNLAMPFVRYRTGDLARPVTSGTTCACGRGLPLRFACVIGRTDDRLVFSGRTVLPVTVRMLIKPLLMPGENYQVVQEDEAAVRVLLTGLVCSERASRVSLQLARVIPRGVTINVEPIAEIRGANNKVRNVISRLAYKHKG